MRSSKRHAPARPTSAQIKSFLKKNFQTFKNSTPGVRERNFARSHAYGAVPDWVRCSRALIAARCMHSHRDGPGFSFTSKQEYSISRTTTKEPSIFKGCCRARQNQTSSQPVHTKKVASWRISCTYSARCGTSHHWWNVGWMEKKQADYSREWTFLWLRTPSHLLAHTFTLTCSGTQIVI